MERKNLRYTILMLVSVLVMTIFPIQVYADTESPYDKSTHAGVDNFTPFFEEKEMQNVSKIPFTEIYGSGKIPAIYLGEGPWELVNKDDGVWSKMRGENRQYYWDFPTGDPDSYIDPDSGSFDLHIYAADRTDNSLLAAIYRFVNKIAVLIVFFFVGIVKFACSTLVNIANINSEIFLKTIGDENTVKTITKVFLGEQGAPSGFVAIAILAFMISLTFTIGRVAFGRGSMKETAQELGILFLSCLIAAMAMFGGVGKINESMLKIANTLSGTINNPGGSRDSDVNKLFTADTGNAEEDTRRMQLALLEKPGIEAYIVSQMGFNSNQLSTDPSKAQEIWGTGSGTISSANNEVPIAVSNSIDGDDPVYNLGYSAYAANSNVAIGNWYDGSMAITQSTKGAAFNQVVDWLQKIVNSSPRAKTKAIKIVDTMTSPNYGQMTLSGLLLLAMLVCLLPALAICAFFAIMGKLIISALGFILPVVALLLLPKRTRHVAKQLIVTYFCGIIRYLIGISGITILLLIVTQMASNGTVGIMVGTVTAILSTKAIPHVMTALVSTMGQMGQMQFAQNIDSAALDRVGRVTNRTQRAISDNSRTGAYAIKNNLKRRLKWNDSEDEKKINSNETTSPQDEVESNIQTTNDSATTTASTSTPNADTRSTISEGSNNSYTNTSSSSSNSRSTSSTTTTTKQNSKNIETRSDSSTVNRSTNNTMPSYGGTKPLGSGGSGSGPTPIGKKQKSSGGNDQQSYSSLYGRKSKRDFDDKGITLSSANNPIAGTSTSRGDIGRTLGTNTPPQPETNGKISLRDSHNSMSSNLGRKERGN